MERSRLTQRAAAKLLEIHYTFLNQILNGRRSPGLPNAVHIERVTGIPVEAWVSTDDGTHTELVTAAARKRK